MSPCYCFWGDCSCGDTLDSVLMLDTAALAWTRVAALQQARSSHAVSTVRVEEVQEYCEEYY